MGFVYLRLYDTIVVNNSRGVSMDNTFLPLLFRMKYIGRWGLMYNTQPEDLMQHTLECAFVAHYLAMAGNRYCGKDYDAGKLAVYALYHDIPEVLTGDLPTPVKYYSDDMRSVYRQIERTAAEKLRSHLPEELRADYAPYLGLGDSQLTAAEANLLKIADKLCAYIKCVRELNAGNREFRPAYAAIGQELEGMDCEELRYFMANCLPAFSLSLDELKGTL